MKVSQQKHANTGGSNCYILTDVLLYRVCLYDA